MNTKRIENLEARLVKLQEQAEIEKPKAYESGIWREYETMMSQIRQLKNRINEEFSK